MGANKSYIESEIPHIWSLMRQDLAEVIEFGESVVVAHNNAEFRGKLEVTSKKVIVDLVRLWEGRNPELEDVEYVGICW